MHTYIYTHTCELLKTSLKLVHLKSHACPSLDGRLGPAHARSPGGIRCGLAGLSIQVGIGLEEEAVRNRTEPAELNRIEPSNSGTGRNWTRKRTEPNRTEPLRVRKTQAEPHQTGKSNFPNRTEPMNFRKVRNRNESNRTGSFLLQHTMC